ncbi:MAG: DUF2586 family protein [Carboxylicivirga sp.]|jgi:hypothetical protein|nr:DUF2586 family protein [Carboxylicivirga sp.]
MPISNVTFKTHNGSLGGVNPSADGIAGLILSHAATSELDLNTPKAIFGVKDAEGLKLTGFALNQIGDFYSKAGEGQELWIMSVSNASLLADICSQSNDIAKKLIVKSGGRVRFWGVNIEKPDSYSADQSEGIDKDVYNAMANAQTLCDDLAAKYIPTRCILPGREWDGDVAKLRDLKQGNSNRVQILLHGVDGSKEARVGFLLGLYSSIAVQRNIGRVASGDLGITEAFLTDGVSTAESIIDKADTIHDKGYVLPIQRFGKAGYFYNDDPTATSNADDYSSFARGRVIDKVERTAYTAFLDFVNDDYQVDAKGRISIGELKRLQGKIDDAVNTTLGAANEISGFASFVDPAQDVLGTGQTVVKLNTQPRAYHKNIVVEIGFVKTLE